MKEFFIASVFILSFLSATTQVENDTLFSTADPLKIALSVSIKTIKNSKVDSLYFAHKMYYRNTAGVTDSINISLKRRGNYRLRNCYFPPLWMKIDRKDVKNTLFEGNKKLKLVLPCDGGRSNNDLIMREYLCYKLYESITDYCFKSRLANIDFTVERGKKTSDYQLKGILIEDVEKTAKRCGGKDASTAKVTGKAFNDTFTLRFDLFQLLISNTDVSKHYQHNSKLIYCHAKYIPLPYDFDMSGLVDAPYSVVSQVGEDQLPIENVRERYYRGHCMPDGITQFVRKEFLSKEEKLLAVADELKGNLSDREIKELKSYLEGFFEILKDDNLFKEEILNRCRPM